MKNNEFLTMKGIIMRCSRNNTFLVKTLENKEQLVLVTISRNRFQASANRAKKSKRLIEGKIVWIEIHPSDFSKGRIIALA